MDRPAFEIVEEKQTTKNNILIFDKNGFIGAFLANRLKNQLSILFVSKEGTKRYPDNLLSNISNLIAINYRKTIPEIPEGVYSHIFVILDSENETLEYLPSFIKQAEKNKARLIVITPLGKDYDSVSKNLINNYKNTAVVFYGDLFGPEYPLDLNEDEEKLTIINNFLCQVKKKGNILISGNGLEKSYPIFLEDVLDGILEVAFGINENSIFLIYPKHGISDLALAHHFHKINPDINIDFCRMENAKKRKEFDLPKGNYLISDKYSIEHKIKHTLEILNSKKFKTETLEEKKSNEKKHVKPKKKKNKFTFLFPSILFLVFLIILPLVTALVFTSFAFYQLKAAKNEIEKGDLVKASKSVKYSENLFKIAKSNSEILEKGFSSIGQGKVIDEYIEYIDSGREVSAILIDSLSSSEKFMNVFNGKSKRPKEDFLVALDSLKKTISLYQKIKAEKKNKLAINYIGSDNFNSTPEYLSETVDVFPDLFGFTKEKKYLILFQNNMELRPGGGFIGSFGILTLEKGRVKDFTIHDVYDADGQLKGHIEPPFPIRRYIPLVHLYLRDSNFNVDFSKGASTSAYLLNEEIKVMVDGVIGVDVTFVKNLLKNIGPVYVSDYKETVTAENLYILTQTHAEKNFFPGSSQKKDFLKSLFRAIQLNLSTNKKIQINGVLKSIGEAIDQKHLLFAFSDINMQNLFSINGMSSSILDKRVDENKTVNDFLGINDANIGINKANYYIKRKITQNVLIEEDGSISERLTVIYKNDSKKDTWPGGDYRNYIRFILPKDASLKSILIDGKEQKIVDAITDPAIYEKKNFKAPKELEVEKYEQDGKNVYGFVFIAPPEKFTAVSIFYTLKKKIAFEPTNIYDLKIFKQPGTEDDLYNLIVDFPKSLKFFKLEDDVQLDKQLKTTQDRVEYKKTMLNDINLRLTFTKN